MGSNKETLKKKLKKRKTVLFELNNLLHMFWRMNTDTYEVRKFVLGVIHKCMSSEIADCFHYFLKSLPPSP